MTDAFKMEVAKGRNAIVVSQVSSSLLRFILINLLFSYSASSLWSF